MRASAIDRIPESPRRACPRLMVGVDTDEVFVQELGLVVVEVPVGLLEPVRETGGFTQFDKATDVVEEVGEDDHHGCHVATEAGTTLLPGGLVEGLDGLAPQPGRVRFIGELVVAFQPVVDLVEVEKWATTSDDRFGKLLLPLAPMGDRRRVLAGQHGDLAAGDFQAPTEQCQVPSGP